MTFKETKIKGSFIFEPQKFNDNRGYFFESYNKRLFLEANCNVDFVQDNQSMSHYGTIRGLHYQAGEFAQSKLIHVLKGKIIDVIVDLRKDSDTFGQHIAVALSCENNLQLFAPKGVAHGFVTLENNTIVSYKCDCFFNKSSEGGLRYDDELLGINWIISEKEKILSEKDLNLPNFSSYKVSPCF